MPVDNSACVHLRQDHKVDPFSADQRVQKFLGLISPRLLHLGGINETEPDRDIETGSALGIFHTREKAISVKYFKNWDPDGDGARIFRCYQHSIASPVNRAERALAG